METEPKKTDAQETVIDCQSGADTKKKWYDNRAKVIFSLQAFPPLGIYALLRSKVFTPVQKILVAAGVTAVIAIIISVKRYFFF